MTVEYLLSLLPLLACPIGMSLMMWLMMRGKAPADPATGAVQQQAAAAVPGDRSLAGLQAELAGVQAQQAAIAAQIAALEAPGSAAERADAAERATGHGPALSSAAPLPAPSAGR